jgi:fructose-1,6-bisphosphatase/sedoheptulose 1,7-bisphosphatase-like protein
MSDIVMLRGHLATAEAREKSLSILCTNDQLTLHKANDMYVEDIAQLNGEYIRSTAVSLAQNLEELRKVQARIIELKKALGE